MLRFQVDEERCIQCGECAQDCPAGIIALDDYPRITDQARCIQCQHCLAVCPTAALSILGNNPDDSLALAGNLPPAEQLATLIKGRRTVRRYQQENLPAQLIDELLNTACHAPTGVNARAVLFTVIRERAILERLRDELITRLSELKKADQLPSGLAGKYLHWVITAWRDKGQDIMFRGAPHLLITSTPADVPCPGQDSLIALTTFDLYAQAKGVGTVWDGICMMALAACPEMPAKLGIPADHTLGYAMAFGAPAVEYHRTIQRGPALVNNVEL